MAGWRPVYHWSMTTSAAYHVLKLMQPFVRIKQRQCALAIQFHEDLLAYNAIWRGGVDPEELARREEKLQEMRALNARGKFDPSGEAS